MMNFQRRWRFRPHGIEGPIHGIDPPNRQPQDPNNGGKQLDAVQIRQTKLPGHRHQRRLQAQHMRPLPPARRAVFNP